MNQSGIILEPSTCPIHSYTLRINDNLFNQLLEIDQKSTKQDTQDSGIDLPSQLELFYNLQQYKTVT